ncbi:hypothetical protein C8J57DRAFT_1714590 [Mycena rebaudengoi]|nr:hypothetical protein C8J57DRAFT_1714590 [Mycena rebaudengoi]
MSTGQLCIEVDESQKRDPNISVESWAGHDSPSFGVHLVSDTNVDRKLVAAMALDDIHYVLCYQTGEVQIEVSEPGTVLLGSLSWPNFSFQLDFTDVITDLILEILVWYDLNQYSVGRTAIPMDELYLFIFPPDVEAINGTLAVRLPPKNETYYWSRDPQGLSAYTTSARFGLPRVSFYAKVLAANWTESEYNLVGQFHRAKGFDPESQDVAKELGYPLVDVDGLKLAIGGNRSGTTELPSPRMTLIFASFPPDVEVEAINGTLAVRLPPDNETYY